MLALRRLAALALNLLFLQTVVFGGGVACGSNAAAGHAAISSHRGASHGTVVGATAMHGAPRSAAVTNVAATVVDVSRAGNSCNYAAGSASCPMSHSSGHCASSTSCANAPGVPARVAPRDAAANRVKIAALRALEPPGVTTSPRHPPPRA